MGSAHQGHSDATFTALSSSTLPHAQPPVACQRVKYTLKGVKFSVVRVDKVALTTQASQPELDP